MPRRKTRADGLIDSRLPRAAQEELFRLSEEENHSLAQLQEWLVSKYELEISRDSISRWLISERQLADQAKFERMLMDLQGASDRAGQIADAVGDAAQMHEANVALLSQALLAAQQSGDPAQIKFAVGGLSFLLDSVAKSRKADADVLSAKVARDRFQFDAAKQALKHAAELQEINKTTGSEREKVEQALLVLFGEKPEGVE